MKKYSIIAADPPWNYYNGGLNGSPVNHYQTMKVEDIARFDVKSIASEQCTLFIWITWPILIEALWLINEWGFKYCSCGFVWVKCNKSFDPNQSSFLLIDTMDINDFFGCGNYTRANTEVCLIARHGPMLERKSASVKQLIYEPVREHSQKPDCYRDRIVELYGDLPRLEMFSRRASPGWDVFGNQVDGSIEIKMK